MIPAGVNALRERWQSPGGRALGVEVVRWLSGKGRRPPRGVGVFEGRVDLRGFAFPDARQVGSFTAGRLSVQSIEGFPEFESVRWQGIDFTGAVIRNARFFGASIENCRFDRADLFDWRLWDSRVTDCSFVGADLQRSAIGTGDGTGRGINVWTRVDFDRANFNGASVWDCVFRDCTFRNARLRKLRFYFVTFDRAVFEGALELVLFDGRKLVGQRDPGPMRDVDFRKVTFRLCEFRCQFQNVTFDDSADIRLVRDYPRVLKRALDFARNSSDPEERNVAPVIEHLVPLKAEVPYDSIFFPADYPSDKAHDAFGRLLERAEHDLELKGQEATQD